ncbi:hypothetical protein PFISCL1PPCAC_19755, partial [Pristionchus fissidentatus]
LLSGSFEDAKQFLLLVSGIIEPLLADDGIDGVDSISGRISPMISSRCPRPIGTREFAAITPVIIGSRTERRGMVPAALTTTQVRHTLEAIEPFPKIGFPRASTTRPSRP